ncbi:hypothetical protein GGX14DRAFT_399823 [Mycena pura]|uniref:Uncharacterized protein n=1 Tax=Mycena pura TaxID=153505 RepID=A0AAD6V4D1_9AGAR|nr:hypothetical protein GGX14DRAFT_399823 [Mycena pura]
MPSTTMQTPRAPAAAAAVYNRQRPQIEDPGITHCRVAWPRPPAPAPRRVRTCQTERANSSSSSGTARVRCGAPRVVIEQTTARLRCLMPDLWTKGGGGNDGGEAGAHIYVRSKPVSGPASRLFSERGLGQSNQNKCGLHKSNDFPAPVRSTALLEGSVTNCHVVTGPLTKDDFNTKYWEDKLGDVSRLPLDSKLHLILSLVVFLGISVRHLLSFIFTTDIKPVKDCAARRTHILIMGAAMQISCKTGTNPVDDYPHRKGWSASGQQQGNHRHILTDSNQGSHHFWHPGPVKTLPVAGASQKDAVKATEDSTDKMYLPEVRSKGERKKYDELRRDFRVGKFCGAGALQPGRTFACTASWCTR